MTDRELRLRTRIDDLRDEIYRLEAKLEKTRRRNRQKNAALWLVRRQRDLWRQRHREARFELSRRAA